MKNFDNIAINPVVNIKNNFCFLLKVMLKILDIKLKVKGASTKNIKNAIIMLINSIF